MTNIPHNLDRRKAIKLALQLGIDVSYGRGGEVIFKHALGNVAMNNRRKDSSRALIVLLRKVAAQKKNER